MKHAKLGIMILCALLFSCITPPPAPEEIVISNDIETLSGCVVHRHFSNWYMKDMVYFRSDGTDIGFNFNNEIEKNLKGTIIIYPGKKNPTAEDLKTEFGKTLAAARQQQADLTVKLSDIGTKTQGGKSYPSAYAIFDYSIEGLPLTSFLVVVFVNDWIVLYRISYLRDLEGKVKDEVQSLLTDVLYP